MLSRVMEHARVTVIVIMIFGALGGIRRLLPVMAQPIVDVLVVAVYFAYTVYSLLWLWRGRAVIRRGE